MVYYPYCPAIRQKPSAIYILILPDIQHNVSNNIISVENPIARYKGQYKQTLFLR